jgi:hypothetical protein
MHEKEDEIEIEMRISVLNTCFLIILARLSLKWSKLSACKFAVGILLR